MRGQRELGSEGVNDTTARAIANTTRRLVTGCLIALAGGLYSLRIVGIGLHRSSGAAAGFFCRTTGAG
eukprot:3159969-Lingulodinium_polyedra.AAC.1